MTAQIGDVYKYRDRQYTIVDMTNPINFHPKEYGLTPHSRCTACWNGFWCEYNLNSNVLLLENLYMFNEDNNYPPLNGVEVSPATFTEVKGYSGKKKKADTFTMPDYMGHRLYKDVNLEIPYTGHILVGDDFIWDYYIHMGYQRAWGYRQLIEFVFEEGILLECNNHGNIARQIRNIMKQGGADARFPLLSDISENIDPSLIEGSSKDLWWLNRRRR